MSCTVWTVASVCVSKRFSVIIFVKMKMKGGGGGAGVTLRLFSKEFIFSYLLSLVNSVKTVSEGTTQQFLLSSL